MSEQAAARFDRLMDALRHPVPTVWDCTPRESLVWFEEHSEGLDERLRPVRLAWWGVDRQEEYRAAREDATLLAYLEGYQSDAAPAVPYGSPEHNARREAFGLEPVIDRERDVSDMADWPWVRMVIDDPATHVDSTASAAEIERAWTDWVRSRTLAAVPHPDGRDAPADDDDV